MAAIVMAFGALIAVLGAAGVLAPGRLQRWIAAWPQIPRYAVAVGIRLVLGIALLSAAEVSRYPVGLRVLGWITLAAAVVLAILGPTRLDRLVRWWTERADSEIRAWSAVAVGLGLFLVYALL